MGDRISRLDEQVVSRTIVGETIVVPIRGKLADLQRIFALDPVADFIWKKLDGTTTLREIRDEIVGAFEVDDKTAAADLLEFVDHLLEEGLAARRT
jgi:hypothetical protein